MVEQKEQYRYYESMKSCIRDELKKYIDEEDLDEVMENLHEIMIQFGTDWLLGDYTLDDK